MIGKHNTQNNVIPNLIGYPYLEKMGARFCERDTTEVKS